VGGYKQKKETPGGEVGKGIGTKQRQSSIGEEEGTSLPGLLAQNLSEKKL